MGKVREGFGRVKRLTVGVVSLFGEMESLSVDPKSLFVGVKRLFVEVKSLLVIVKRVGFMHRAWVTPLLVFFPTTGLLVQWLVQLLIVLRCHAACYW